MLKFVMLTAVLLFLGGCAGMPTPVNTPVGARDYAYNNNLSLSDFEDIKKPLPDGRPRYRVEKLFAVTTADTEGIEDLKDGSNKYTAVAAQYVFDGMNRYVITSIASERGWEARKEARVLEERNRRMLEDNHNEFAVPPETKHGRQKSKYNSDCGEVGRTLFCFDDVEKLNGNDLTSLAHLLREVTPRKMSYEECPGREGTWFIEKADSRVVNISLMCGEKFVADIIIDNIKRAGKNYYKVR